LKTKILFELIFIEFSKRAY